MSFVCPPCLLFGTNLHCNPGRPSPPHKGHSLFPWEKCSAHPRERPGGTRAEVAVARPLRRWTGSVQIVSDEQKGPSGSHVRVRAGPRRNHGFREPGWQRKPHGACALSPAGPTPPNPQSEHQSALPRDGRLGGQCAPRSSGWACGFQRGPATQWGLWAAVACKTGDLDGQTLCLSWSM